MKNIFLSHYQKNLLVFVFSLVSSWVYCQAPTITSFTPTSGAVGSTVTITGTGFNTSAANNVVYFDGVKAAVTASTSTSLTVTVPSGTSGFSVLNYVNLSDKLSCASKLRFSTTFGNGGFSGDFSGGVAWGSNLSFSAPSNSYSSWGYGIKTPNLFADFNNDGKPDYAHIGSSTTTISPNTSSVGQISFGTQISLNSGGNGLQVGDIDNDGLIDLVIFNSSTAFVYRNNSSVGGTISFQSPISVSIATSVNRLLLKDMNSDGLIDVIGSNGTNIIYLLNTTSGSSITFNSVSPVSLTAPASISDFGIVDFDNNNQLDIIALHSSGYSIKLNSAAFSSLVSSSNSADMMQVGDVNNDGFIDFAINYNPYSFKFFKNSGSNTFSEVVVNMTSSSGLARAIQLAEMSGNNLPDVIGCEFNSSRTYQIGNNTSTSSAISFPNCTKMYWGGSNFNTNVAVNDVDGDGRSDLTAFMSGNYIINRNIIGIPTISSFTPTSGGVGASVTISGTYFVGATDVKFNGVSATSITVNSASSITAIAPVGTTGTIQVITPGGTATSSSNFTFNPSITKSSNFTSFTTCSGTPSNTQSFTVSGNNLTASVSIAALTGYEYSTDGTTYSSSLTLTPTSGSISSTTVYVRLTSSSSGSPSGTISLTSTNATTQTIAVTGTVTATSLPTATTSYSVCLGDSAPTISATPAASHTLRWYTVPTGGTASTSAPVPDVSAAGITSYYVSQFNSSTNCESARVAITVTVYALPSAPTATTTINYCQGATATALAATATSGYSLQWYTASTGGTASTTAPTPTTTTVGATPYYVSQKAISGSYSITTGNNGNLSEYTSNIGQSFQVANNVTLNTITFNIIFFYSPAPVTLKIYNGFGGALLATANSVINPGNYHNYNAQYSFSGQNLQLNAGQTYYMELTSSQSMYVWINSNVLSTGTAYNNGVASSGSDLGFTLASTLNVNPCESPRTAITVNVNAVPTITGAQSMTVGGSTLQLTGSGTPNNTTPWVSSNTAVATVSSTGVVTAVAGGNTTITYTNASSCSITAAIRVVDCAQPFGNALAFGQSTDFVQVNSSIFPSSTVTNFTIETWIKPSSSDVVAGTPGGSWFGFLGSYNTLRNPSMWITNSGALHASWSENGSNSGTPVSASTPSTLVANRWTHVALVKDGTTMRIYANGIQVNSATCSASITVPNNFYWLGKVDNQFNGALDEVRFWSTARTQSQLQNTMYTELVGNETGLLAYFDFNEGIAGGTNTSISTLTNKANNASNGTLTNFTKTGTSSNFVGSALTSFAISGDAIICANSTSQYTHPMSGGTWTISNGADASISSSGLVTTLENEDVTISYTYTLNGCSITDTKAVSINTPAAPTATTTVNLCQGVPATALTATASNGLILQWYTAATGGTASTTAPTPVTTSAGSTTYYVSQKANTGAFTIDNAAINSYANYVSDIGQTFTTSSNVKLTSITLKEAYFNYSNASTVLKVYNGVGGSLVATANSAYVNSNSGWLSGISFSFTNQNIILTAGQTYYFQIVSTSAMYPKYSNAYANGSGYINSSIISEDFAFKLESTIDASPCESSRTAITVNVNAVPTITGAQNMTVGGSTLQMTGSGTPDATTPWTSSNTAVATISSTGLVTAVGGGSTTLTYTVSNGCTKTAVISVVDCSQPLGNVLHFDGVDDYFATASNIAALNITANLTLETWIKFDQTHSDWVRLIGKGDANNRTYGFWLGTDNKLLFQINGTPTGLNFSSTTPLQPGNWYHIAAIRNGNTAKILINGVEDATATTSVSPQTNTFPLTVGYGTLHNYLKGSLEDVRVWNIARSDSQIQQGMYNSIAGNETGLVAYYDFNQGIAGGNNSTITAAIDKTTNALNGTLTNFGKTGSTSNFIGNTMINFAISGATTVCANSTSQYTHSRSGGTWSISNGANATINATGLVTTLENENVTISYTYTINGCSVTDTKSVSINTPAAPVATSPVNLCKGITATALTATPTSGYDLKWYTVATGGTASTTAPTPTTTTVGSTTYYVSQKAPSGPFIIDNTYNGNYANNISTFGQTFTPANNIILNSITLKTAYINTNTPNIVLKVYNGYGGALLATANSPYTNSYGYTWFNDLAFSFSGQNIALTGGQTYYFEFVPNATMYPGYSNAYANGTGYIGGGVISQDFAFKLDATINSNPCESPRTAITVNVSEIPTISGVQNMTVGGATLQLTGSGTPDATTPWASSNTSVASISSTGVVTAQGGGTTTITYTNTSGCSKTATIRVIDCAAPFGNALNFDGVNDYAVVDNVGNNSNLSFAGTANFTIEAWVKRENTNGIAMIFSKYNGNVAGNYWLGIDSTGKPILSREASPWGVTATNPMPVNEWHHIAATYDGSQTRIYVDGVLNNTTSAPLSINQNVSAIKVNIGAGLANNSPAYLFKGELDEIRVWNVARTATQIQQSFITTLQGNESGLVAYYDFNQGTPAGNNTAITSIVNTVNSASNGTLTNFTKTGTTSNFIGNTTANISISGASNLCANATSQFTHIVAGGTWSISSGAAATVSTSGLVTTVANEDITLSYTYSINGCSITVTKAISINSPAAPVATTTVNLCQGATATALTATALTGHTLQWYTVANAGTASTTVPSPSTATTGTITFYVSQKNNTTACEGPRTAIVVTVNAATAITAQPSAIVQTYCINATPTDLSVTATGTGLSYQWYSNALASTTGATVITGATTATYTPITTTASALYYYCVVTGTCGTVTSGFSGKITIAPASVGGTATATATTVCTNSTTTLTLTGHTGTIQWQQSADGTTGWANVTGGSGATTATYTTPPLTTATYYRALVTNSTCLGDYSTVASVSLNAATALTAQPATTAQNVCINGITATIAVTATGSGITYQWYRNTSAINTGGTLISGATNSVFMPSNTLLGTTYYYCVVSSTCSSPITSSVSGAITIAPASVAGTINGTASVCLGSTTTLTLSGNVGTIQWQVLDSTVWTDIAGATSTTFTTPALTQNTTYRAVVTSGICSAATSANVNVVVNPLPVISGTTSVGAGESVTLTATTSAASSNAWVSSTPAVASVTNTGVVNGLSTGTTTITYTNSNGCTDTEIISVVVGTTQTPVLILPATNTLGATTLNFNYSLPETPLAGSVKLTFIPTSGGTPIVWTMNNATSVTFSYVVGTNPTSISNVVSGVALGFTTYNVTLAYQDAFANPASNTTNTNIQTLAPPMISFANANYNGVINQPISIQTVNSGGGMVTYSIAPTLPTGLTLNTATGLISGTPTVSLTQTSFTVTATNAAGADSESFNLFIDADTDGDGIGDVNDPDIDGDGILNGLDICPYTVNTSLVSQPNAQTVNLCISAIPPTLTVVATGQQLTYQWYFNSSNSNTGGTAISGATSASYVPSTSTVTRFYYVVVSGTCGSAISNVSGAITISPTSVAGSIAGATTVCSGTNTTVLTLSGNTGTIQWQSSTDNITFTNIVSATTSTYTAINLTVTTYYRAVVTSGVCSSATTTTSSVNVSPTSVAGNIAGATTVCSGTNATVLTLSGNIGAIQWQSSIDNVTFTNITGATASTYTATNITATTYYRAVVTSGVCSPATTTAVTITVSPTSLPGSIAGATSVCSGTNSTVLTLSGNIGTIQWQWSTDNVTFFNIPSATTLTHTATNITTTTYYRAVITSGVCSSATTNVSMIAVNPTSVAGSIAGATTVCSGTNSTVLTLSGNTGTIQWQSSIDNVTFTNIASATASTYTATNITTTTYYRAVVSSGVCSPATTTAVTITVNPTSVAGSIAGATTVCSGTNSTVLTLSGNTGIIQWQSSNNNVTFTNITGATTSTYTATNITATTYYRVVVSSGVCSPATTTAVTITVNPTSVAGSIAGATTVCSGTNATVLTLTGNTGTIQWQSSTNNVTFTNITGATASTYTATNITATTYYRAVVSSGVCSPATTTSVTITVNPTSVAGSIAGATTVCSGTNSTLLTLSGNIGTIQWQSSTNNVTFTNITGATASTYTATNITTTTYYRAIVTSGVCLSATSVAVTITYIPIVAPTAVSNQQYCYLNNPTVSSLVTTSGVGIKWYASATGGTPLTGSTPLTTATTYYASQTISVCESPTRVAVTVLLTCPVDAIADNFGLINGYAGATTASVLSNDTINGGILLPSQIILTGITVPTGLTLNANGSITIAPQTASGTYNITYRICEVLNPTNCDNITFSIIVGACLDFAINDCDLDGESNGTEAANGTNPSDPCSYTNPPASSSTVYPTWSVLDCDGDGVINGQEITDGTSPTNPCSSNPINITVPLSASFLNGDCDSDGLLNGEEIGSNVNYPNDSNGNGIPDYLEVNNHTVSEDNLEVYSSLTPNGDGNNDLFIIRNIENYPENNVSIYNRWGIVVYDVDGYGQDNKYFKGVSEGRITINSQDELPIGTYFYIIKYKNNNGEQKQRSGYLYINR
jgi:gliding motility-associated-like protein